MDGEPDPQPEAPSDAPTSGEPVGAAAAASPVARVETAVSPVIRGDSVSIPTPAWGVALSEDVETLQAELVETGEMPELGAGAQGEGIPESEWSFAVRQWPGWLTLLVVVATVVVTGLAVAADAQHHSELATTLAWVAIGCSIAAFLGGMLAAVFNRGRVSGVVAALVGIFANPWVLLQVLTLLKG